ncbi:MAG: putative metal-dependent hydrolase [Williamsia sp.]|nr:putative metal-dependent hydrolase [Williamsia sp.]
MFDNTDLRYPIGKLADQPYAGQLEPDERIKEELLLDLQMLPQALEYAILNLDAQQLDTPYRPGGWTVQQVVHHVPDSHMNAYTRFKLGLTENNPPIKPYDEGAWAQLVDTRIVPVNISLTLLHALHARWFALLNNLDESDWKKTVYHPEHKKELSLWHLLKMYAWHGKHHVAHINSLRDRMGW